MGIDGDNVGIVVHIYKRWSCGSDVVAQVNDSADDGLHRIEANDTIWYMINNYASHSIFSYQSTVQLSPPSFCILSIP